MEWLKDKKNLPIVIALAAVVLLGALGLIAVELNLFGGGSAPATTPTASSGAGYPGGYPGGLPSSYPGGAPGGYPGGAPGGYPGGGVRTAARTATAAAAPAEKTPAVDPRIGADPFALPGSAKALRCSEKVNCV